MSPARMYCCARSTAARKFVLVKFEGDVLPLTRPSPQGEGEIVPQRFVQIGQHSDRRVRKRIPPRPFGKREGRGEG